MTAVLLALIALFAPAFAGAAPALVTTSRGDVDVVAAGQPHDAPVPPFVLQDGESLRLSAGALVVVLYEGHATQVAGPATVDHASLKAPVAATTAGVDVLDELLARHVSTAPAGASRGSGDATLVRPVPGSALAAAHTIAWRCEGCGELEVQVHDLLTGDVLWKARGRDSVAYTGPALAPGAYAVVLQGRDHAFTVIDEADRKRTLEAVEAAKSAASAMSGADVAAKTSVVASVWLQAGLPSDALWVLDEALQAHPGDASLVELRATFERRAGLAP